MADLTLRDVANIIKSNDSEILDNQEEQTDALKSIDSGIKKFLADQQSRKLDDLEDRRERRARQTRVSALAAVGGLGAAGMDASGNKGFSNFFKGLGLGTLIPATIGLLFKPIKSLFNKLSDSISKLVGTERGKLLTENDVLKSRLRDLDTKFKQDIKTLKTEASDLKSEIAKQKRIEAELRRQHAIELKSKDATIRDNAVRTQKNLEAAQARRLVLENELKTAQAELKSTKDALKQTQDELKAAKKTPKPVNADQLGSRVAATSKKVAGLEDVAKTELSPEKFRATEARNFGAALKNLTYDTPSGPARFKQVLPNGNIQFEGNFGPRGQKTTFAISPDKLNDLQKIKLFGTTDVTPASLKAFNRFARVVDVATLDPFGVAEATAAGTSAMASRMGATTLATRSAAIASNLARLNPHIIAFYATGGIKQTGMGMPSEQLAALIADFLRLIFRNSPLKDILAVRKKIHSDPFFGDDRIVLEAIAMAIGMYDTNTQMIKEGREKDIGQILGLLLATPTELGRILLQLHKGSAKFYDAYEEYRSNSANMQKAIDEVKSSGAAALMGRSDASIRAEAQQILNRRASEYAQSVSGISFQNAATPSKLANIKSLAAGEYFGGEFGSAGTGSMPPINMINTDNSVTSTSSQAMIMSSGPAVDTRDFMFSPNPLTGLRGAMGF